MPHTDIFGNPLPHFEVFDGPQGDVIVGRDTGQPPQAFPRREEFTVFHEERIRDTDSHRPVTLVRTRTAQGRSLFRVRNDLDQQVTLTIVGDTVNNPGGAPDIGGATTIAANTEENIATDIWAPWIGLRAAAGTAPTSGDLTIIGVSD